MYTENMTSENKLPAFRDESLKPNDLPGMAAGLVHEIKNPLAAIHMHLQLLEGYASEINEDELKDKIQNKIRYIRSEISGLNQSMHDFLRLLRAEKMERTTQVNINQLVQKIVEFVEPQVLREGIDLQFHPGSSNKNVLIDPTFIRQIVLNLILNAVEAFEKSDRPIEERKIIVSTGEKKPYCYISVIDNGPGIPPSIRERIFDPFYTTRKRGSGLGLSIVKRMVAAMKGHLELFSKPGEGADFTIYFAEENQSEENSVSPSDSEDEKNNE